MKKKEMKEKKIQFNNNTGVVVKKKKEKNYSDNSFFSFVLSILSARVENVKIGAFSV